MDEWLSLSVEYLRPLFLGSAWIERSWIQNVKVVVRRMALNCCRPVYQSDHRSYPCRLDRGAPSHDRRWLVEMVIPRNKIQQLDQMTFSLVRFIIITTKK